MFVGTPHTLRNK